jgi:AcrR family transcriptional regulator
LTIQLCLGNVHDMHSVGIRGVRGGYRRDRDLTHVGARTRILDAAYDLFSREGINAVGIDRIIAAAPVAKATLYHHFASKEDLVCAFLDLRGKRWTADWLQAEIERRAADGEARAIAVFDALDEWINRPDFEGCSFINTLIEIGNRGGPIHTTTIRHLDAIRAMLEGYAKEAGAANPRDTAFQLQILMMGAIVSARRGDGQAARRARTLAELLVDGSKR